MYLRYKDHKPGKKTRPTATGNSSNKLGLSCAVAEVLEAVAATEPNRYNTISSEDMMARIKTYNTRVVNTSNDWLGKLTRKLKCQACKIMEKVDCIDTELHQWDGILSGIWPPRGSPSPGTGPLVETRKLINSSCCGQEIQEMLERACLECGPELDLLEAEFSIVGSDVKALYPSIKSQSTGEIVRKRIEQTSLEFEGFNYNKGLAYIAMNRHLTGDLTELENILPDRKSGRTTSLKMSAVTAEWEPPVPKSHLQVWGQVVQTGIRWMNWRQMDSGGSRISYARLV